MGSVALMATVTIQIDPNGNANVSSQEITDLQNGLTTLGTQVNAQGEEIAFMDAAVTTLEDDVTVLQDDAVALTDRVAATEVAANAAATQSDLDALAFATVVRYDATTNAWPARPSTTRTVFFLALDEAVADPTDNQDYDVVFKGVAP